MKPLPPRFVYPKSQGRGRVAPCNDIYVFRTLFLEGKAYFRKLISADCPA